VRAARGFTLLEVVISLTIIAMIALLVYATVDVTGYAVGGGERAAEQSQRVRIVADIMMRQIKSTAIYRARDEDYDYPYFRGARRDLAFVTAAAQTGGGGLSLVTYRVEPGPRLVLSEATAFSPEALGLGRLEEIPAQSAVLLDGFTDLHFEYLRSDDTGTEYEWEPTWDGKDEEELPGAVRLVIEGLAGIGAGVWQQEIPLMITAFGETDVELEHDDDEDTDDLEPDEDQEPPEEG
jgi:prepilin-type N-terminal cleavage/methylation domain-containing protein